MTQAPSATRHRRTTGNTPNKAAPTPTRRRRKPSLDNPANFLNRELTWLEFNKRVLHEAEDERTPLLERLKFIAIVASNLDEFFMKRIGGLKQQIGAGVTELTVDGRTPQQQIDESREMVREIEAHKDLLLDELLLKLREHNIRLFRHEELDQATRTRLRNYYLENIYPLVTPQVVDPAHPFPFISNLSFNLLVTLQPPKEEEPALARVKIPIGVGIPRFLPIDGKHHFVSLEEVIANNLDLLFPGLEVIACERFFVTRNASTEREESRANDLLSMIEMELRDRRFAPIVRVLVEKGMNAYRRGLLAAELGLDERKDVYETDTLMSQRHLFQLAGLRVPKLHDEPHHPVDHHRLQDHQRSIFYLIRDAGSLLLQHPYESFVTSVVRFLDEASRDPKVLAIKMTLYRTTRESRIVELLVQAARNGKQVAAAVELKARFDEAANIEWATRMEEAGVHVTYGVVGLKTHCKVIMVVRRDYNGLRRYVHIGTGNYHAGTARLYTDMGLLTCEAQVGRDVTELFNYLTTGYTAQRDYRSILPAPKILKKTLLANIEREIDKHSAETPGLIQLKTNALEDVDITKALYRASQAGVKVELVVRDTCRLRPGIAGLSENASVISVVGRFLEHSRIYYFRNGGNEEYFIGSADLMMRNLESRVEVVVRIDPEPLKEELRLVLDTLLEDRRSAWEMQSDGSYIQRQPEDDTIRSSQLLQVEYAENRLKHKKRQKLKRMGAVRPSGNT